MKKILLLLTLINTSAFGADVRIENKDAGSDIVFRQKNAAGTEVGAQMYGRNMKIRLLPLKP